MRMSLLLTALAMFAAGPALAAAPKCASDGDWLVIERPHKDGAGNSYIVRSRNVAPPPACSTRPAKGDRLIGRSDDAFYLLKLAGNYLLIDSGTGPDRELLIYDARDGKPIFRGGYDDGDFKSDAAGARFWTTTATRATAANCPDLASIEENGLTATIEASARFDAAQGKVTVSKTTRCRATQ